MSTNPHGSHLKLSSADWTPGIHAYNTIFLIPSMHMPFYSKQFTKLMLGIISSENPDLLVQTGSLFENDTITPPPGVAQPIRQEQESSLDNFLAQLSDHYNGPLLINGRRIVVNIGGRQESPTFNLADHPPVPTITRLSADLCVADNISINSPYSSIPGNYALTLAKELDTSVATGQTNRRAQARFTRRGAQARTIQGVEIGTAGDLRRLRRTSYPVSHWKNGFAIARRTSGGFEFDRTQQS